MYKREEDLAFKPKFDYIMQIEAEKARLKKQIALYKYNSVKGVNKRQ